MLKPVIVYAKRSPIGKLGGQLNNISAPKIAAQVVQDAIKKIPLLQQNCQDIIMGQVLTAGSGQAPARQTALYGGLGQHTKATTINKVCGSGLQSVMLACDSIRLGYATSIIAGGQENMSLAPHLLINSRSGYRYGSKKIEDHIELDGLSDPYEQIVMGKYGELCATTHDISRDQQDEYALRSYKLSQQSITSKHFENEIVAIEIENKKQKELISQDEEPFGVKLEKLKRLRPAFTHNGTITAGNASSINDGAAILTIMEESYALKQGITPLAKIIDYSSIAQDPKWFTTAPIKNIENILQTNNLKIKDIEQIEINEAFSTVPIIAKRKLNISDEQLNPFGGAVSLGHPIGASGARILVTLINGLRKNKGRYGLASICIGGGEASSILIENWDF
jgi:acetyl-CoA C-acetyltransferase